MHRFLTFVFFMLSLAPLSAQEREGKPAFDPEQFEARLEAYVVARAELTAAEKAKFLPVYREMRQKQGRLFDEMRRVRRQRTADNEACAAAIRRTDALEIQIREITQEYHQRLLTLMPATRLMRVLRAENQFHRQALRGAAGHKRGEKKK